VGGDRMRWRFIAAAVLFVAAGGGALAAGSPAASIPPPWLAAIYNWTGIYLGISAGSGTGTSNWLDGVAGTTGNFPIAGSYIGATIGASYQIGELVFGIEGDQNWTNLHGSTGTTCGDLVAVVPPPFGCETKSKWLATVRGRIGYAFDRVLVYGTAGAAFGNVQNGLIPPTTFDSSNQAGWAAGGGIEFAFAANWSAKVEYLFVDLPNGTCTSALSCGGAAGSTATFSENIVRAGVNFKFGPW
jgi:outer membrane immunogenic protein